MSTNSNPNQTAISRCWRHHLDHGWTRQRLRELRNAPTNGWHYMAPWIRWTLSTLGALLLLAAAGKALIYLWASTGLNSGDPLGLLATVTDPVHTYLTAHTATLPVTAAALYTLWELTGLGAFFLSALTGSNEARITWAAWGAATVFMVWHGTAPQGRFLAAAITTVFWTAASTLALSGVSLRPIHFHQHTSPPCTRPQQSAAGEPQTPHQTTAIPTT